MMLTDTGGPAGAPLNKMIIVLCAAVWACMLGGCSSPPGDVTLIGAMVAGRYGDVRLYLRDHRQRDRNDRQYLLDLMRLGIVTLGDGYPRSGQVVFDEVFDTLRTQGINADKTVESVVLNEDRKFWKGEPFEQALAFFYVGLFYSGAGEWGNVRAAADNSLFYLRDFTADEEGTTLDAEQLVYRVAQSLQGEAMLDRYTPVESDFALGYLLSAIANKELQRPGEADEQFSKAQQVRPSLAPLIDQLRQKDFNTLLVVDYGVGPRKIGIGPDGAIARFVPITPSDDRHLIVTIGDRTQHVPVVCDVNIMAADHRWNNLEDVRLAKSYLGSTLLVGGGVLTGVGAAQHSGQTAAIGGGLMAAGLFSKAGAHADTRYCDAMPQRVYLVPATISSSNTTVTLVIEDLPQSKLVLSGLDHPSDSPVQLRYVRLNSLGNHPQSWAVSGKIQYANDHTPDAVGPTPPYILGGRCVRKPTQSALADYHRAGLLRGMTLGQLQDLYRTEGITWQDDDAGAIPGLHVLEGGHSLAAPQPGTTGFARLFGQFHAAYWARSDQLRRGCKQYGALSQ